MNLNSLDKSKRNYQPYADEPGAQGTDRPSCSDQIMAGAQGTDRPSCSDQIMVVLLCVLTGALMVAMLALAPGGGL